MNQAFVKVWALFPCVDCDKLWKAGKLEERPLYRIDQIERDHGHESRAHGGPCDTVETRSPIGVGHHVLASRAAGIALREHGGLLDVRVDDGDATPSGGRSEHLRKDS